MNRTPIRVATVAAGLAAVLALTACASGTPAADAGTRATAAAAPAGTSTPVAAPSSAVSTPSGPASATAASTTATPTAATGSSGGCSTRGGTIPSGAATALIGDIDHDGRRDTEFMTQQAPFRYGIRTATGALLTIDSLPAGPGRTNGWTSATFDGPTFPLTVVDDGREADLYAVHDCRFVRALTSSGAPFVFALGTVAPAGGGTGVVCTDQNGGQLLASADAVKRSNGRYDVLWSTVSFFGDPQGVHASYQPADTRYSGLREEDPPVVAARRSACLDTPIVSTSGR